MKKNEEIKLGEVIDRVMKANSWDQTALGKRVGATQGMVSRMRKGDDWEQHWQILMKLRQIAVGLNIISPNGLKATSDKIAQAEGEIVRDNNLNSQEDLPENGAENKGNYVTYYTTSLILQ